MTLWIKYLAVSILMLTSLSSPLCLSFCTTLYIAKITSASPMATVISTRKHRDCSSLRGGRVKEGTQLAEEGTHQLGGGASMARSLLEPWEAGMRLDSVWGMTHMKIAWILFSILGRYLLAPSGALIAIPTYYWSPPTPLFQITPVLNTGLSLSGLSEPVQLYNGYNAM